MKKKIFSLSIVLGLFLLGGCSSDKISINNEIQTPTQYKKTIEYKKTGIDVCDKYMATLRCISNNSTGEEKVKYQKFHDDIIISRKDINSIQLTKICESFTKTIIENPSILQKTNCKI